MKPSPRIIVKVNGAQVYASSLELLVDNLVKPRNLYNGLLLELQVIDGDGNARAWQSRVIDDLRPLG